MALGSTHRPGRTPSPYQVHFLNSACGAFQFSSHHQTRISCAQQQTETTPMWVQTLSARAAAFKTFISAFAGRTGRTVKIRTCVAWHQASALQRGGSKQQAITYPRAHLNAIPAQRRGHRDLCGGRHAAFSCHDNKITRIRLRSFRQRGIALSSRSSLTNGDGFPFLAASPAFCDLCLLPAAYCLAAPPGISSVLPTLALHISAHTTPSAHRALRWARCAARSSAWCQPRLAHDSHGDLQPCVAWARDATASCLGTCTLRATHVAMWEERRGRGARTARYSTALSTRAAAAQVAALPSGRQDRRKKSSSGGGAKSVTVARPHASTHLTHLLPPAFATHPPPNLDNHILYVPLGEQQ